MENKKQKTLKEKLFELQCMELGITRDTQAFNYKYATLEGILSILKEPFRQLRLLVSFDINLKDGVCVDDKGMICITVKVEDVDSGESISSSIPLERDASQKGVQALGSAITYYRRYLLLTALNLAPEDDDGEAASVPAQKPAYQRPAAPQQQAGAYAAPQQKREYVPTGKPLVGPVSLGQIKFLEMAINRDGYTPPKPLNQMTKQEASEEIEKIKSGNFQTVEQDLGF